MIMAVHDSVCKKSFSASKAHAYITDIEVTIFILIKNFQHIRAMLSETNWTVQPQKMARGLNFQI